MSPTQSVQLRFATEHKKLREELSAVTCIGNTLWVANDETGVLERFTRLHTDEHDHCYGDHSRFLLSDYVQLPVHTEPGKEGEEVDIESLDYTGGYLWVTGSHSLVRRKPDNNDSRKQGLRKLAELRGGGNRYLLARIPVGLDRNGICQWHRRIEADGQARTAACLHGTAKGNDLMDALQDDPHLQAFLPIPSKDNGLDIEGLAATQERVFLGLRGPVLSGWACILELELVEDKDDPTLLRLATIGPDGRPYRKHFLQLAGLGVRDLCVQGNDLLILAGPTMSLEGEQYIYRWPGGANPKKESLVDSKELEKLMEIPVSEEDHAEGICLFPPASEEADLLVVYDPAAKRRQVGEAELVVDLFPLDG